MFVGLHLQDDFVENARLLIFETYCRIHQCIDLQVRHCKCPAHQNLHNKLLSVQLTEPGVAQLMQQLAAGHRNLLEPRIDKDLLSNHRCWRTS